MSRFGLIPEAFGSSLRKAAKRAVVGALRELRDRLTEDVLAADAVGETFAAPPPVAPRPQPVDLPPATPMSGPVAESRPKPTAPVPVGTANHGPPVSRVFGPDEEPGLFSPPNREHRLDDEGRMQIEASAVEVLRHVFDPEIPVNIYDLGLVYGVAVSEIGEVVVTMTLTSPNCPAAQSLPGEVQDRVAGLDGVRGASIDLVWDPPWSPDRMSEEARLVLNM